LGEILGKGLYSSDLCRFCSTLALAIKMSLFYPCVDFVEKIDAAYECFMGEELTTIDRVESIAGELIVDGIPKEWANTLGKHVPRLIMKGLRAMVDALPSTPPPPSPSVVPPAVPAPGVSIYSCGSFPIELSDEKQLASGVLLGSFVVEVGQFGREKHEVVVKLNALGRDLSKEYSVLKKLNEMNVESVVRIFDYVRQEPSHYLVVEYGGDTLTAWMTSDVDTRKLLAKKVVLAVSHIHAKGVMHGDMKPDNILVFYKPGRGFVVKLCDFDSARMVGGPDAPEEFAHNTTHLKWTRGESTAQYYIVFPTIHVPKLFLIHVGWSGPEVTYGKVGLLASIAIDLFAVGLIVEMLLHIRCDAHTTVLPTGTDNESRAKLHRMLTDEAFLHDHFRCHSHSHAGIVYQLCRLDPAQRGTIDNIVDQYERLSATGFQKELTDKEVMLAAEKHHNQQLEHIVVEGLRGLELGQQKIMDSIEVGLSRTSEDFKSFLRVDVVRVLLDKDDEGWHAAVQQLRDLNKVTGEQKGVLEALCKKQDGVTALELDTFWQKLVDHMKGFSKDVMQSVDRSESTIVSSLTKMQQEVSDSLVHNGTSSQTDITAMLTTFQKQLAAIESSTATIADEIEQLREVQTDVLSCTNNLSSQCTLLLLSDAQDNKQEVLAALAALGEQMTTLNAGNMEDLKAAFDKCAQFADVSEMEELVMHLHTDAMEACQELSVQQVDMLKNMGSELKHIAKEVGEVHEKMDELPGRISRNVGVIMAVYSEKMLNMVNDMPGKLEKRMKEIVKKTKKEDVAHCVEAIKGDLQDWLAATISESSKVTREAAGKAITARDEALLQEMRGQHKLLVGHIDVLTAKHEACNDATYQRLKDIKKEVTGMLTGIKLTLDDVVVQVATFSEQFVSLETALETGITSQLRSHSAETSQKMQIMMEELHSATKKALKEQTERADLTTAKQYENMIAALGEMQDRCTKAVATATDDVKQSVSTMVGSLVTDFQQQVASDTDTIHTLIAATDVKLKVMTESLGSAKNAIDQIQQMMQAQREFLVLVEERGNHMPVKFIILPDKWEGEDVQCTQTLYKISKQMVKKCFKPVWENIRLFFVCDVSNEVAASGPKGEGYEIRIRGEALKKLTPILLASIVVLRLVAVVHGVPRVLLPDVPPELLQGGANGIMDAIIRNGIGKQKEGENAKIQQAHINELFTLIYKSEGTKDAMEVGWEPNFTGLKKVTPSAGKGTSQWVAQAFRKVRE
jgi:serine/threonine protein kinase